MIIVSIGLACLCSVVALANVGEAISKVGTVGVSITQSAMPNATIASTSTVTLPLVPTDQPTIAASNATPAPIATKGSSAQLGDTLAAFVAKLGPYIVRVNGSLYGFQTHCGTGETDCEQVHLFPGRDQNEYVQEVTISTPAIHPWDVATARTICQAYMPTDAHFQQEIPVMQGNAVTGIERIYVSATLGNIFSADSFLDIKGNLMPLGTFDILYLDATANDQTSFSDCLLAIGVSH